MGHIVVTPAEEEDEVIVAGGEVAADPEPSPEPTGGQAQPSRVDVERADAPSSPKRLPKASGAYRETTLDDLDSAPMPFAQRLVIIAAVVCIIGALVYYFVAMR